MAEIEVHEHFQDAEQQVDADHLGMWIFLATEIMTFGGLFMGSIVYRVVHTEGYREASGHLDVWIGTGNTVILLTSGLFAVLGVAAAREGRRGETMLHLALTALLGALFLGIKIWEWSKEAAQGLIPHFGKPFPLETTGTEIFFNLYFISTGLHFLHLAVGVALVAALAARLLLGGLPLPGRHMVVTMTGLYWSLVDIVWILLFTTLYLPGR